MLGGMVWTLEGITFHHADVRDAHGVQWILTNEKGFWGAPGTGATLTPRINFHGAFRTPGWKKERTVTLTGRCYAHDYATLRRAESQVQALLSDPRVPGTLTCYSELGALELSVFLDDPILCAPLDIVSEPGIEFSIQVVATDPRKSSVETQMFSTGLPADSGTGLNFTEVVTPDPGNGLFFGYGGDSDGLTFGTSNASGVLMLDNIGTAPADAVYTLTGPLDTPVITSAGGTMKYHASLAAGEFVVITPAAPSVALGGLANRRELLYPADFAAFAIPPSTGDTPGALGVGLSHTGPSSAGGHLDVVYRYAWF
jgi:hypothetical protein